MLKTRILLPLLAGTLLVPVAAPATPRAHRICKATTQLLASSCRAELREEHKSATAICLNLTDPEAREECFEEASEAHSESDALCRERREARAELCRMPGFEGAYDPQVDPADFVAGIDNPFAPFRVGSRWVYEKDGEEGFEHIEVEVLAETREILGVECTTVRDRVWLDGELIEDTLDWLAQHVNGDVWYFGELVENFEDGLLADLDGSFEAGKDGAKPGIWVRRNPTVGEFYRQEWLPREAEDVVEVVDLDADEVVPFDNGNPILKTRDFTPLEPGVEEFKFYVPGVGMVLEVDPESGEILELIEYTE